MRDKKQTAHIAPDDVAGVAQDVSGQSEVTNLHHLPVGDQHVPGCQVSVNTLGERGQNDNGCDVCLQRGASRQGSGSQQSQRGLQLSHTLRTHG